MNILVLGDPHGILPKNLDKIVNKNKIELIICVGDIGFVPKKPWLKESWAGLSNKIMNKKYEEVVAKIASFKLPVLTLRGDTFIQGGKPFADKIMKKYKNVINKFTGKYNLNGQDFILFDISFESTTLKESNKTVFFLNKMRKNMSREKNLNKLLKENPNSILITHNPPYGYLDKVSSGKHVGSKILAKSIEKYHPKYVFCGHIHEAKGKTKMGKTTIYNLGSHGDYVAIDTNKNKILESNFLK
jgi:Icc-related predicted phosphoesterase